MLIDARVEVLNKISAGHDSFGLDPRRRFAVVQLQDHVEQVEVLSGLVAVRCSPRGGHYASESQTRKLPEVDRGI
jgi:hypothetical protein